MARRYSISLRAAAPRTSRCTKTTACSLCDPCHAWRGRHAWQEPYTVSSTPAAQGSSRRTRCSKVLSSVSHSVRGHGPGSSTGL
eukprot:4128155-Prymnesium_polylepis.1